MKTKIITAIIMMLYTISSYSQTSNISVNGLKIWGTYTNKEIVSALGTPTLLHKQDGESGYLEIYYYNNSSFYFLDGVLTSILIREKGFIINESIGIGSDVSLLKKLTGDNLRVVLNGNKRYYVLDITEQGTHMFFCYKDNLITEIEMTTPI